LDLVFLHLATPGDQVDQDAEQGYDNDEERPEGFTQPPISWLRKMSEKTMIRSQIQTKNTKKMNMLQNTFNKGTNWRSQSLLSVSFCGGLSPLFQACRREPGGNRGFGNTTGDLSCPASSMLAVAPPPAASVGMVIMQLPPARGRTPRYAPAISPSRSHDSGVARTNQITHPIRRKPSVTARGDSVRIVKANTEAIVPVMGAAVPATI
jgi:hypothetical protein